MDNKAVLTGRKTKYLWSKVGLSIIAILLVLILGAIFLNCYVQKSSDKNRLETVAIGNEIVEALESYHVENGQYPESMERLVPKYLNKLKQPLWGEDGWNYELHGPNSFVIKVGYKDWGKSYYPVMYYSSVQKAAGWIYDN